MSYISVSDLKTYLGITGSGDDTLLGQIVTNACAMAERETGRTFSVTSNTVYTYSLDGQASMTVHDRPYNDATRVIEWNGATLTEGTNVWFLQDRRNPDVTTTIQVQAYDVSRGDWYKADPYWWDKNLDAFARRGDLPNSLVLRGTVGHPEVTGDVKAGTLELAAWLYWRAKSSASGLVQTLNGTDVELAQLPEAFRVMVRDWTIRTAVVGI